MLWISKSGRWEFAIQSGFLVGFNTYEDTYNVFLGIFRFGMNGKLLARRLRAATRE